MASFQPAQPHSECEPTIVINDVMGKSHEQRLITKERIAMHTNVAHECLNRVRTITCEYTYLTVTTYDITNGFYKNS